MGLEEFVKEVAEKFGDRYDCSCVTEQGVKYNTNVAVKCYKHGLFWITPYQLLHNDIGCFECYKEKWWNNNKKEL